jgi:hypothetical protein
VPSAYLQLAQQAALVCIDLSIPVFASHDVFHNGCFFIERAQVAWSGTIVGISPSIAVCEEYTLEHTPVSQSTAEFTVITTSYLGLY